MSKIIVAVNHDAQCGSSPSMPYVDSRFDGKEFTRICKLYLAAALLRCGFEVIDCNPDSKTVDAQDLAIRINRNAVDAAVTISYAAFGSRRSFNDVRGFSVRNVGRLTQKSKVFCEDIYAKLAMNGRDGKIVSDGGLGTFNCVAAVVDAGYCTYFDEAKLIYDTDYCVSVSEYIAMGICEYFNMPYIRRDDIFSYPLLCTARRGKKVKMLQCMLNVYGNNLPIDGIFGSETDAAVKTFCERNGKSRDGGVTPAVWRDLLLTNLPELKFGSQNNAVWYIQRKLYSKLYPVDIDGVFGEKTLAAINEFLSENVDDDFSLSVNDMIDDEVYKLLTAVGGGRSRLI